VGGSSAPTQAVGQPQVELRLAGEFGVVRDGAELADGQIGSRKSRTLLKLLAVERPALVPVDRIVEVLWDARPPAGAEQNVATLVSRLRAALGAGVIQGGRQGYRLAVGPGVGVDLDAAARYCDHAERTVRTAAAVALAAAERALGVLSAGTALADEPYATWADPAREELSRLLRRGRLIAAQAALGTGDAPTAARYAEAAMAADPLDETAHRWYMSAAAAAGEQAKALAAYAALSERLAEQLGTDPSPQTRELHLAILREQPADPAGGGGRGPAPGPAGAAHPGPAGAGRAVAAVSGADRTTAPVPRMGRTAAGVPGLGRKAAASPALAGRDAEIGALRAAWHAAVGGEPGLVMIVGEAGIGKTALAELIAAEAETGGAAVLRTRCYETERSLFLQPVVEALTPVVTRTSTVVLGELLGEHAPAAAALLPEAAALLGQPAAWHGSVEMERRRAFEAVTALLRGLAARSPVMLVIDDLQYAGQSTVELLHYLGRHVPGSRLLAVVTVRAEHDSQIGAALAPVASRVEIGPLPPEAVRQLAREAGQGGLADRILQRTGGHALFVVEVLRALSGGDDGLPDSLLGAVQARVRRCGAAVEILLRAASVLGATVDPLALSALLDLTPAASLELCEAALAARLLVISGRDFEFANDLIREVLYASTPEPTRLAYHRRAADLLTGQPEALARHAAAAGDWPRAARAWLLAAEEAMRRYAATDAATLATQAHEAAERVSDAEVAARALLMRGRAHEAVGVPEAALNDLTRAAAGARAAGDPRLEMLALRELGGDVPLSLGLPITYNGTNLERGLQIAESLGDRASEADLLCRLAVVAANRLDYDKALEYGLRGLAAGRASGAEQALVAGLDALKTTHIGIGDVAALSEVLEELGPLVRRLGDPFRLQWVEFESAFVCVAAADWDGAVQAIQAGIEANRRAGYPHFTSWYVAHLGWLARLRGHDDEAVAQGRRALALTGQHPHPWGLALGCAMLGGTLLLAGDRAEAIRLFERGLAAAEEAGVESVMLRCAAPLAAATGSPGVLDQAAGWLAAARIPDGAAWVLGDEAYLWLARAWLGRGEPERARAVLAPLLALAQRVPWIATLAAALAVDGRALIELGEREPAASELRQAAQLAREHGLPHVLREARSAQRGLRLARAG
jgi:DNA-binding SARP family transcriptional activator/tetratricopeptide (TPR) repeat protein